MTRADTVRLQQLEHRFQVSDERFEAIDQHQQLLAAEIQSLRSAVQDCQTQSTSVDRRLQQIIESQERMERLHMGSHRPTLSPTDPGLFASSTRSLDLDLHLWDTELPNWDEDSPDSVSEDDVESPKWDDVLEDSIYDEVELAMWEGKSKDIEVELPIWDVEFNTSPSEEEVNLPLWDVAVEEIPSLIQVVESFEEEFDADQFQEPFPLLSGDLSSEVINQPIYIPKATIEVFVHNIMASSVLFRSFYVTVASIIAHLQDFYHGNFNDCTPHQTLLSVMSLRCFDPGIIYMEYFPGSSRHINMLQGEVQGLTIVRSGLQHMSCSILAYTGTSISIVRSIYARESNINGGQGPVKYISVLRLLSIGVVQLNKATEMYGLQIKFFRFAATIQDDQDAAIPIPWTDIIDLNVACIILFVSGNLQSEMVTSFAKLFLFEQNSSSAPITLQVDDNVYSSMVSILSQCKAIVYDMQDPLVRGDGIGLEPLVWVDKYLKAVVTPLSWVTLEGWPPPVRISHCKYTLLLVLVSPAVTNSIMVKLIGVSLMPCGSFLLFIGQNRVVSLCGGNVVYALADKECMSVRPHGIQPVGFSVCPPYHGLSIRDLGSYRIVPEKPHHLQLLLLVLKRIVGGGERVGMDRISLACGEEVYSLKACVAAFTRKGATYWLYSVHCLIKVGSSKGVHESVCDSVASLRHETNVTTYIWKSRVNGAVILNIQVWVSGYMAREFTVFQRVHVNSVLVLYIIVVQFVFVAVVCAVFLFATYSYSISPLSQVVNVSGCSYSNCSKNLFSLPSINMLTSFPTDHGVYCYWSLKVLKHCTKYQASLIMISRVNKDRGSSITHDNFFSSLELSQADLLKNSLKMLDTNIFTKVTSEMGCCPDMGYHDLYFSVGVIASFLPTFLIPAQVNLYSILAAVSTILTAAIPKFESIDSAVSSGAQATATLISKFDEYWRGETTTVMRNISFGTRNDILYIDPSSNQGMRLFEKCFRKICCLLCIECYGVLFAGSSTLVHLQCLIASSPMSNCFVCIECYASGYVVGQLSLACIVEFYISLLHLSGSVLLEGHIVGIVLLTAWPSNSFLPSRLSHYILMVFLIFEHQVTEYSKVPQVHFFKILYHDRVLDTMSSKRDSEALNHMYTGTMITGPTLLPRSDNVYFHVRYKHCLNSRIPLPQFGQMTFSKSVLIAYDAVAVVMYGQVYSGETSASIATRFTILDLEDKVSLKEGGLSG